MKTFIAINVFFLWGVILGAVLMPFDSSWVSSVIAAGTSVIAWLLTESEVLK